MQQERLTRNLAQLISFDTTTGLDTQQDVLRLFSWYIEKIENPGFQSRVFQKNGFNSLIIEPKKKNVGPVITLLAHIDVVPAPKELFTAREREGKLYGRGASDMKAAAAVFLELLNTIPDVENKNVRLVLVSDEEIGGFNGVNALLEAGELQSDVVILPDGGDNFQLVEAAKGFIHVTITARGKSAHGSRPWEGENAFDPLLSGYAKLLQTFNNFDHGYWVNTVNLGRVAGGLSANTIPDSASLTLDLRYTQNFTHEQIMEQLYEVFGPGCQYQVTASGDFFNLDLENTFVTQMIALIEKTTQKPIELRRDFGSSDARFFTRYGTPVLQIKPEAGAHHTDDEWVDIESLQLYTALLAQYIANIHF